jgi:two-component system LytT family response regulator
MAIFKSIFNSSMLRTIIIDDEESVRRTLQKLIKSYCPTVRLVGEAEGVESGVKAIKKHHPDLVLLDIKMDDGTGFDLLKQLEPVDFKVIFITAYDEYAIHAIKFSALDYLLKPVDPDDLTAAIGKAEKLLVKELNQQLDILADNMQTQDRLKKKIILKTYDNIHLVKISDIVYCESDDNYTYFHLLNKKKILVSTTLKEYEEMLGEYGFFRAHRSYLVNLGYIETFEKAEGGAIILIDNMKVPVSSRKKEQLLELLERISQDIKH